VAQGLPIGQGLARPSPGCRRIPEGLVGHAAPELLEPWQAVRRFVAGDQARIDGADRGADDPVRLDAGLVQCLVDHGLVGAERTATL